MCSVTLITQDKPSAHLSAGNVSLHNNIVGCGDRRSSTLKRKPVVKARFVLMLLLFLLPALGAMSQSTVSQTFSAQTIGTSSTPISINITASTRGTVATVQILTLGASGLDFVAGAGSSNCIATNFTAAGQFCSQAVTFT